MDIFLGGLWDAVKDTLLVIPVLYLAYLLVSYFSHNDNEKYSKILHKTNKAGPVIGAFLGCIPQCGFSSVMSQLYSKKIITLGTLIAVFIATSDEAIPLMISQPEFIPKLLILIAIKVIYAIIVGYIIDGMIKLFSKRQQVLNEYHDKHEHIENHEINQDNEKNININQAVITKSVDEHDGQIDNEVHMQNESSDHEHKEDYEEEFCCGHKHKKRSYKCDHAHIDEHGHDHTHSHCCATNIFLDALKHTAIIIAYVFIATLIINLIRGYCGGLEPLQKFFTDNVFVQIAMASLIGLIPNCAASVFLVEMFMEGVLLFPALVAGLTAGAGVGLIVLFTANYKKMGMNIFITIIQYVLAILIGIITNFIPIW